MNSERPTNGTDNTDDDTELRARLAPFAGLLRSDAVWADPPPEIGEAIVQRVHAASVDATRPWALTAATTAASAPVVAFDVRRRRRPWVAAIAAAAATAALAFGAGVLVGDDPAEDEVAAVADVDLAGTELAPDARASGDVVDRGAGYAIRLDMAGLPPAADGEFYEGWLRADDGEMVSVGTFHMRSGDSAVVLWSGVRIAEYGTLVVTAEQERAGAEASDRVMLQGPVERRSGGD